MNWSNNTRDVTPTNAIYGPRVPDQTPDAHRWSCVHWTKAVSGRSLTVWLGIIQGITKSLSVKGFSGAAYRGAAFRESAYRESAYRESAYRGAAYRVAAFRMATIRFHEVVRASSAIG